MNAVTGRMFLARLPGNFSVTDHLLRYNKQSPSIVKLNFSEKNIKKCILPSAHRESSLKAATTSLFPLLLCSSFSWAGIQELPLWSTSSLLLPEMHYLLCISCSIGGQQQLARHRHAHCSRGKEVTGITVETMALQER